VAGPGLGLAPSSLVPCRGRFCSGGVFIGRSGCSAGVSPLCYVFGLGLGFPFDLDWLAIFVGESLGTDSPIPVLCSIFLYINMYACVWCMCVVVVWVVMASLCIVHLSSLFGIAV